MRSSRTVRRFIVVAGYLAVLAGGRLWAAQSEWHLSRGLALGGYDAGAFQTESRAIEGDARFQVEWKGVRWRCASAEHRQRFLAEPGRYAPQFGGYCAWAVSRGYTASGDPQAWSVVDGRPYLNYSMPARSQWEKDQAGNIAKGRANWPAVLEK